MNKKKVFEFVYRVWGCFMGFYVYISYCNRYKIDENIDFCINLIVMVCKMIKNMKCVCDIVDISL